jgi:hypothetical protein
MQPIYVTVSSSGGTNSSPWKLANWHVTPINIGIQVQSSGGNWQIDVTLDDPTRAYPNPSSSSPTIFQSSQCAGGGVAAAAGNAVGVITQPIAAWRLTSTSTTLGGTITASVLQAGIG